MLIDTHVHLDASEFDADRDAVIAAARAAGVGGFIVPAVEVANFDRVAALSAAHADIRHAYGIHPLYVDRAENHDLDILEQRLSNGDAIAVGEIGLDLFVPGLDRERQEAFFVAQLKLARRFNLPVILHVRRAVDPILKHLRRIELPGGIAHAFNGSRQQADTLIALGFKLGFGGAMTYEGSRRIRALASELPLESIVLETDAPDMPPAWARGGRNQPSELGRFAAALAALRDTSLETVMTVTGKSACQVLGRAFQAC